MDVSRKKLDVFWPWHIWRLVVENTVTTMQMDCKSCGRNSKLYTGHYHHHPNQTHCHQNNVNNHGHNLKPSSIRWRPSPETESCYPEHRSLSSARCLNIASVESKSLIPVTQRHSCQGTAWSSPGVPLLLLLLLLGVVSSEQTGTAPLPNHFLETELPVLDVYGVEGGQARIPCDVTPPTPRDTPILILIARGTTPLYSVDARSGSSSSATHWINREVLGDRAQFQLPARFRSLGDPDFSKFPHKYDSSSPHQPINRGSSVKYIPEQQLPHQNSRQYSYNTIENGVYQEKMKEKSFDIQINRGKHKKVVRHAHDKEFSEVPFNDTSDQSVSDQYSNMQDLKHVHIGERSKQISEGRSHRKCLKIRKIGKFVEQINKNLRNSNNNVPDTAAYETGQSNPNPSSRIKGMAAANELINQFAPRSNNVSSCHLHSRGSRELTSQEEVIKLSERQARDKGTRKRRAEWREKKPFIGESLVVAHRNSSDSSHINLEYEFSIAEGTTVSFREIVANRKLPTQADNSREATNFDTLQPGTDVRSVAFLHSPKIDDFHLPLNVTNSDIRREQDNMRGTNKRNRYSDTNNETTTSNQTLPIRRNKFRPKPGTWHNIQTVNNDNDESVNRATRSNKDDLIIGDSVLQPEMAYGILVIKHLLRTDGGNFHCRVDFREAPTRHSQARLSVIVPPSRVDIRGPAGLRVSGMVGPYGQGDTLSLWCTVSGGVPAPSVTWWLDDELIDDVSEEVGTEVTTNNLTLVGLQRRHLQRVLSCRTTNSNLTTTLETSVTIDMKLPPLTVHIPDGGEGVKEGRLHKLTCSSEGSRPPVALTWWARARQLTHTTYQESPDSTSSTSILHLLASAEDDGLQVSCRATNSLLGPAFALEDSVKITVLYPPRVTLKLSPLLNVSNIDEHDDVFLDCIAWANPPVTRVQWNHNGAEISPDQSKGIVHSNMSLVLQGVTRQSSGMYTCTAFNRLGSATSNELQLTVKFTPVCSGSVGTTKASKSGGFEKRTVSSGTKIDSAQKGSADASNSNAQVGDTGGANEDFGDIGGVPPKVYGTGVGVPVNITCSVEAHPQPHTFTWSLNATSQEQVGDSNSGPRKTGSRSSSASKGSSSNVLTYTPHTSHEFGTLLCWAENAVGKQSDPCVFQVVPASTPASVHNCTVSPTSPSSPNTLVLKCLPGWDGGLEQTFTLKVMEGKNFTSNRRGNGFGKQQDSISPLKGGTEEWISGGAVQYIKDQRQSSGEAANASGERGSGRQRGSSLEKGVLAVLAGQTSPHFTVSGLGAGQEYILQVFSTNARGNSSPLVVNYVTPIDVAEGRLSSDTAYSTTNVGSGSGTIILAVVLAVMFVLGGLMTAAVVLVVRRKRDHRQVEQHEEEHHLRSTTMVSVEECQRVSPEFCVSQTSDPMSVRPQSNTNIISSYCSSSSPTLEVVPSMSSSLIPTISRSNTIVSSKFSQSRGPTQRERIVRTVPHEPPDPDILLYRLKSSDV